ncbi:glycosyltransferase family 39 protein [candidate division KSB1 bacterium]|nr:glycosyltransferase family 39 protein [candidate division KSB1 bacterium]
MLWLKKWLWVWCVLALWLSIGIGWGIPGYDSWAPDEVTPARVMSGLHTAFSGNWYDTYPPFHYYVISAFYLPFLIAGKLGFIDTYAMPWYGVLSYVARMVSVLMGLGIIYFVYRLGQRLMDRNSGIAAASILALTLSFNYYTKVANVDIPYIFWFTFSLLFFVDILKYMRLKDFVMFGVAGTLAICTKDQAYALFVIPAFYLIFTLQRHIKFNNPQAHVFSALLDKRLWMTALTVFVVFVLAHNWMFNFKGFMSHVQFITSDGSKPWAEYGNSLSSHLIMFLRSLRHINYSFGWALTFICLVGLIWSYIGLQKQERFGWLWMFPISYYIFFITVIRYNYVRFFLPVCIVLALYGGLAISTFLKLKFRTRYIQYAVLAVLGLFAVHYTWGINSLMLHDSRYAMEDWITQHVDADAYIGYAMLPEYAPRLDAFPHHEMVELTTETMETKKPDYLVLNWDYIQRYRKDSQEYQYFQKIRNGQTEYELVFDKYNNLSANHLKNIKILTNINKLNPQLELYKRTVMNAEREGD